MYGSLKWKLDVDEGGDSLYRSRVLCVIDKVTNARLVLHVPFKYIKLCVDKWLRRRFWVNF